MADAATSSTRRSALDPLSERIVELIHDRGLRPGDPMPTELELIQTLSVSRNSVREAVRPLRALGIVDTRHGHGSLVGDASLHALSPSLIFRTIAETSRDLEGLRNLVEIRELLEVGVIGRLAGRLEPETLDRLAELCEAMTRSDLDPEVDREFHRVLYAGLDNPLVGQLVDVFWDAYHEAQAVLTLPARSETAETVGRHRAVVEALRSGDADAARSAMRAHFAEINRRLDSQRPV